VIISQTTESLSRISEAIARGGIIAFRTDTFYGLGVDPFNRDAVHKLRELKGSHNPILIIIGDREEVTRFIAEPTPTFHLLAEKFWPGPLTLIGRAAPGVPNEISAGTQTIGVRLPDDDNARALAQACGGALTATSANPSHQKPATTVEKVFGYFGDAVDLIVDGGEAITNHPSTVVDISAVEPRLIREGLILWPEIQATINRSKTEK